MTYQAEPGVDPSAFHAASLFHNRIRSNEAEKTRSTRVRGSAKAATAGATTTSTVAGAREPISAV